MQVLSYKDSSEPGLSLNEWLEKHSIEEIECIVPDITGNTRGKFIAVEKFLDEETRLPESILLQNVLGKYNSERHELIMGVTDGDMYLKPDLTSLRLSPWTKIPTAQIVHDCFDADGNYHPMASRSVLKKVLALYRQQGWKPVLAPEVEFYLVKKPADYSANLEPAVGESGRPELLRQSYTLEAIDEFDTMFEAMYDYCELQDLAVGGLMDETGEGQMEINFSHGDPLDLADQVFSFKRTIRKTALRHGMVATFMAKPIANAPGSSMHMHQSVVDITTGKNLFVDELGQDTPSLRHFIGGLQKYTPNAVAFYAPFVNSYRRFVPYVAAPINTCWGYDNRSTGIRVPKSGPNSRRVENRFCGIDANPYIAFAASLASGYLGMMQKIEPTPPLDGDAFEEEPTLSRTLITALSRLDECDGLREAMGSRFVDGYLAVKHSEFEAFNLAITSWEREHLLLTV